MQRGEGRSHERERISWKISSKVSARQDETALGSSAIAASVAREWVTDSGRECSSGAYAEHGRTLNRSDGGAKEHNDLVLIRSDGAHRLPRSARGVVVTRRRNSRLCKKVTSQSVEERGRSSRQGNKKLTTISRQLDVRGSTQYMKPTSVWSEPAHPTKCVASPPHRHAPASTCVVNGSTPRRITSLPDAMLGWTVHATHFPS
jgi:hypothetical protein